MRAISKVTWKGILMALVVLAPRAMVLVDASAVDRTVRLAMAIVKALADRVAPMARHVVKVRIAAMVVLGVDASSIAMAAVARLQGTATMMIAVRPSTTRTTTKATRPTKAAPKKRSPQRLFDLSR